MELDILSDRFKSLINNFDTWKDSCLILSVSDLKSQAIVKHLYVTSESDLIRLFEILLNEINKKIIYPIIFKVDKVIINKILTYSELKEELVNYKFGYFRYGIIFDNDYQFVLLESELNSNGIIDDNELKLNNKYIKKRFNNKLKLNDDNRIALFTTESYINFNDDITYKIDPSTGYRRIYNKSNPSLINTILRKCGEYLLNNISPNGQFKYLYFPIKDKYKQSYNILRHLGTTWSLLKLYEKYEFVEYKVAIYQAIKLVIYNFLVKDEDKYFIKYDGLINCGATALTIITLIDFKILFDDYKYDTILKKLINGLLFLSNDDGSFKHKLNIIDKSVNTEFQTIYYHDESLFALIKYYTLTKDINILNRVKLGLDYCIEHNTSSLMDHWLSYALNEFTKYDDSYKYLQLGINNFDPFLENMSQINTIYNIILELLCQSKFMLDRCFDSNLNYNKELFNQVLPIRAEIQFDGFGWDEIAMYFKHPKLVLNSIFIRHKHFRIRIDDIQHTVLGLLSYLKILGH